MNKKQFIISLVFISVFSFLGGIVGGVISGGNIGFAGDKFKSIKPDRVLLHQEFGEIETDTIWVKKIFIKNYNDDVVGVLHSYIDGQPRFEFYSAKYPYGARIPAGKEKMSRKEEKEWLENSKETEPVFGVTIFRDGPHMWFKDKDFDERISIVVKDLNPYISFQYNNKERLTLGTNDLLVKSTDTEQKVKGSICAFDNKGNVIGKLP